MRAGEGVPDPQWDFTLLIREALDKHGKFVSEVDTRDAQALVDLQWASRQAGRLLGVTVKLDLSAQYGHADSIVTATVRCVEPPDAAERARAAEGLERLLASVREMQRTGCLPTLVPTPRSARPLPPGEPTDVAVGLV